MKNCCNEVIEILGPTGDKGPQGPKGDAGPKGDKGPKGDNAPNVPLIQFNSFLSRSSNEFQLAGLDAWADLLTGQVELQSGWIGSSPFDPNAGIDRVYLSTYSMVIFNDSGSPGYMFFRVIKNGINIPGSDFTTALLGAKKRESVSRTFQFTASVGDNIVYQFAASNNGFYVSSLLSPFNIDPKCVTITINRFN